MFLEEVARLTFDSVHSCWRRDLMLSLKVIISSASRQVLQPFLHLDDSHHSYSTCLYLLVAVCLPPAVLRPQHLEATAVSSVPSAYLLLLHPTPPPFPMRQFRVEPLPHQLVALSPHPEPRVVSSVPLVFNHRTTPAVPTRQSQVESLFHRLSPSPLSQSPEQSRHPTKLFPRMSILFWLLDALTDHIDSGLYRESVTLVVGTLKLQYTLHKGLLCFYSDFFRAALNGSFKEAKDRRIEFPEVDIAFQVWLYTQNLPKNEVVSTKFYPEWPLLIKLWIFGDGHQIPLLQNSVMDAIIDKVEKDNHIPIKELNLAYSDTLPGSPLHKAFTDIMVYRSMMPGDKNCGNVESSCLAWSDDWPKQACLDVMAEMSRGWINKASRPSMPMREKGYYHVHLKGEHC